MKILSEFLYIYYSLCFCLFIIAWSKIKMYSIQDCNLFAYQRNMAVFTETISIIVHNIKILCNLECILNFCMSVMIICRNVELLAKYVEKMCVLSFLHMVVTKLDIYKIPCILCNLIICLRFTFHYWFYFNNCQWWCF